MQRVATFSFAVLLGLSAIVAKADPVVTVGAYNFAPGATQQQVQVTVADDPDSGAPSDYDDATGNQGAPGLPGINLYVSITNAAGAIVAGSPVFHLGTTGGAGVAAGSTGYVSGTAGTNNAQGGDVVGHGAIFSTTTHNSPGDGGTSSNKQLRISMTASAGFSIPSTTGDLLATLWIDTTGVAPGSNWIVKIDGNPTVGPSISPLNFADGGALSTALFNGTIHIIPEPSSIVMGLFAAAGLAAVAIRRRRHA